MLKDLENELISDLLKLSLSENTIDAKILYYQKYYKKIDLKFIKELITELLFSKNDYIDLKDITTTYETGFYLQLLEYGISYKQSSNNIIIQSIKIGIRYSIMGLRQSDSKHYFA